MWPGAFSSSAGATCGRGRSRAGSGAAKTQPAIFCLRLGTRPGISASRVSSPGQRGAELRHRARAGPGCRGGAGCGTASPTGGLLHLAAGIHDDDALGDLGHHAEVVGDQHDGRADAVLEVAHQVEDLRLDGDVERGGRLVGDQQLRVAGERDGDHHALAHAARELVRVFAHAPLRLGNADQRQHLDRAFARPAACDRPWCSRSVSPICRPTVSTGFRRGHRLLEDHADLVAADVAHLAVRAAPAGSRPLKRIGAGDLARRLRDQPQDGHGGDRLAAAGSRRRWPASRPPRHGRTRRRRRG